MADLRIIHSKKFGIHIATDEEESHSSIRFGGINQGLLRSDHELTFYKTITPFSWIVTVDQIDFNTVNILKMNTKALINPGYPYIAAPKEEFDVFRDDLRKTFPEDPI